MSFPAYMLNMENIDAGRNLATMLSHHHIVASESLTLGVVSLVHGFGCVDAATFADNSESPMWAYMPAVWLGAGFRMVEQWAVPAWAQSRFPLFIACAVLLVCLGAVLPDIDSSTSHIGRHIPFPGPHRGITHSNWMLIAMAVPIVWVRIWLWLWLGMFFHDVLDAYSAAGRVGWYPLGRWRVVPSGSGDRVVVSHAPHHRAYVTGGRGEVTTLVITLLIALLAIGVGLAMTILLG